MAELRVGGATLLPTHTKLEYREVPVGLISLGVGNIRPIADDTAQQELNENIGTHGQFTPGLGYRLAGSEEIELVLGFRRLRAVMANHLPTYKILLMDREPSESERTVLQIAENLHRKDLTPMEEANAYSVLQKKLGTSIRELAGMLNVAHTTIARALALTELPEELQAEIESRTLTPAHGRALARLPEPSQMLEVHRQVRARALTAEQTEKLVSSLIAPRQARKRKVPKPAKRTFSLDGGYIASVLPRQVILRSKGSAKAAAQSGDLLAALASLIARLREESSRPGDAV